MSAYRRSKYSFGDYPTAGGSSSSAYHSALAATSSAASLTRTNYSAPISSLVVNGSMAPTSSSCISSMINTRPSMNRYTSSYSASKLTSTLTSASGGASGRPTSSSSIYTSRSPRLQSYLRETSESAKPVKSSYSRPSRYDLESSRSRSYSHSGLYDQGSSYRSRSSSVRDTSPYDAERDRDLVMSMRSQSAMSGRATSRDRTTYTSSILDDPMISTYSRSLTSDPLMTSSVLGSSTVTNTGTSGSSATLGNSSKKYGSDEWSEATWLNNLRISAGMEPIPMPNTSSASNSKSLAYEAVSTLPRMLRSNSSTDLTLEALKMSQGLGGGSSGGGSKTGLNTRARHQTLAYGVSASDLNLRNSDLATAAAGFSSTILRNGSDNDILVARVPSREGEVYDVRGFESDMSAAIMNARSRRHSMDNEIIELHPPLVTFGSIDYDGDLPAVPAVGNPPPPPAPYDHKNLVVVNRNDLESILVSKSGTPAAPAQNMLHKQHQQNRLPSSAMGNHAGYRVPSSSTDNATTSDTTLVTRASNNNVVTSSSVATSSSNHVGSASDRPPSATDRSQNGEIDYRKLWEQAQLDNSRLRDDLARTRDELSAAKKKLETMVQTPSTTSGLTDTEKKEKMALEKKLSEMEEELKLLALSENLTDQQLEHLKNDNQRLRDENGALIRVISKLSK